MQLHTAHATLTERSEADQKAIADLRANLIQAHRWRQYPEVIATADMTDQIYNSLQSIYLVGASSNRRYRQRQE